MPKAAVGPLIGYARVSTQGQDLAQQRATLREADCTRIFEEKISGATLDRPELRRLLDHRLCCKNLAMAEFACLMAVSAGTNAELPFDQAHFSHDAAATRRSAISALWSSSG